MKRTYNRSPLARLERLTKVVCCLRRGITRAKARGCSESLLVGKRWALKRFEREIAVYENYAQARGITSYSEAEVEERVKSNPMWRREGVAA